MRIHPAVLDKFGYKPVKQTGFDEVIYCCPFCAGEIGSSDKKGHLYVNQKKLLYFCHRCGSKGSVLGDKNDSDYTNQFIDDIDIKEVLTKFTKKEEPAKCQYYIPSLTPYEDSEKAYNYLVSRDVGIGLQKFYDIRVGDIFGDMFGRVIIPNKVERNIYTDMFVGRTYINHDKKYKNPVNSPKSKVVFNLHRIREGSSIIITEGAFSAISAGKNAVAIYGKYLSNYQYKLIVKNRPKLIYVSLDSDAFKESVELCSRFQSNTDIEVRLVELPHDKDPSDLGREKFLTYLDSASVFNRFKVFLSSKYAPQVKGGLVHE